MTLPTLDVAASTPRELDAALRTHGAILLSDPELPAAACDVALGDAAALFGLPGEEKRALDLARSPHFRGYSRMHNERDFREQFHFGRERAAVAGGEPYERLMGPNLWPSDHALADRLARHFAGVERAGVRLLAKLAEVIGSDHSAWLGADPYLVAKCIGYHPQGAAGDPPRRGVAAHLDFSLVTLTLQDDVGGLEVRGPDGRWEAVVPVRGAFLVHVGELLDYVSGGRWAATPHRVVNPSTQRTRHSIPVFVNPSLDTVLNGGLCAAPNTAVEQARDAMDAAGLPAASRWRRDPEAEHVHAVLEPDRWPSSLHFGVAEWRRKGENVWCARCVERLARPRAAQS